MEVWPALDLFEDQVVRLRQGRFDQITSYGDPQAWLQRLLAAAPSPKVMRVHLVDLAGARQGHFSAWQVLNTAVHLGFQVEVGGGFRDLVDIRRALDMGAQHVIMGTALLADHLLDAPWFATVREHVTGSLDIAHGTAMIRGWEKGAGPATEVFKRLGDAGLRRITITDVSRDGTLDGMEDPQVQDFWQSWATRCRKQAIGLVAGGGIRDPEDLLRLALWQVPAAVVGRAWLENRVPPYPATF